MKICPKCQKTYNDDNLNFCLDDGAVLGQHNIPQNDDSLPETVMMSPPRQTSPNQPLSQQSPPVWGQQQQQSSPAWGSSPQMHAPIAKAKSKAWIWVLGILGLVVVLCGGGAVGFIAFVMNADTSSANSQNKSSIDLSSKPTPSSNAKFEKIDLSVWPDVNPLYATAEFKNGEFIMGTLKKTTYYVMVTKEDYKTDDATTRLTVRNTEEGSSNLGYGLIFHSETTPLTAGYAFLVDADKQRYRVVKHTPKTETDIIKWRKSTIIKDGTQKNVLEIRDENGDVSLYINGQKVDSIKSSDGYRGGVPGVYSGGGVKIAFSDFEIGK